MFRYIVVFLLALFCLQPASAQKFQADSNINITSTIVANNVVATVIRNQYATMYGIQASNNGTAIAYVKLYNAATATCGSGTPVARYMIPKEASGSLLVVSNTNGDVYSNGITMCVTTGILDSDTAAPAASTYIVNVHWK